MRQPKEQFSGARQDPAFLNGPKRRNIRDLRLK
jgi:hypothetical protein